MIETTGPVRGQAAATSFWPTRRVRSERDRWLAFRWIERAYVQIVLARWRLLVHPVARVPIHARIEDRDVFPSQAARREAARGIGRATEQAARLVPGTTHLPKALAAQNLLRRAGLPSRLHIGYVWTDAGSTEPHAWLECEGEAVVGDDPRLRDFVATLVFDV